MLLLSNREFLLCRSEFIFDRVDGIELARTQFKLAAKKAIVAEIRLERRIQPVRLSSEFNFRRALKFANWTRKQANQSCSDASPR